MSMRALLAACAVIFSIQLVKSQEKSPTQEKVLFDFADEAAVKDWSAFKLPELKSDQPAPKVEIVSKALKLTFDGGDWPTVSTTKIPGPWNFSYQTLKAELTVDRPCYAYFRIVQAKPNNEKEPRSANFERTTRLVPGRNEVALSLSGPNGAYVRSEKGDVAAFVIGMYQPGKGQTMQVANVRLNLNGPEPKEFSRRSSPHSVDGYSVPNALEYQRTKILPKFKVLGTDQEVIDIRDLGKSYNDKWTKPNPKTIDEVQAEFKDQFQKIQNDHPKAVMAILREEDKGFDPANPDKLYAGWKIAHISCHGPDGPNPGREKAASGSTVEAFMRHRGALIEVNLDCIPKNAKILAARFAVTRVVNNNLKPPEKPNMYVVEPCNRTWDEKSVNCYFYAPRKPWKAVSGTYFGQDADFEPIFLAHGPAGGGAVTVLDFTEALKYLRDGKHPNHGFFLHGDAGDYMLIHTHRTKELKDRPALLVIYESGS